ncbi:hypothetical protein GUJ93_ZPchr0007g3252 [Zizania palustris]|uniref:TF-B3 domain-containing protein n=1 Tax=Zizania palustris TaxID=103762 RepID=A0A8J5VPW3_ZIZPA|nr:hypothetical protein GUJ93_ZPchr0007g3252 [Zizania palustris]
MSASSTAWWCRSSTRRSTSRCGGSPDAATGKGVLLNFEDGEGKVWRFRYSYWNSSQSYVLTKGWSRFVREKGLRAGDTIVFSRSAYGPEKLLFIDCKKNKSTADDDKKKPKEAARVVKLFGVDIAGRGSELYRKWRRLRKGINIKSYCSRDNAWLISDLLP